jgi:hypothetical protein
VLLSKFRHETHTLKEFLSYVVKYITNNDLYKIKLYVCTIQMETVINITALQNKDQDIRRTNFPSVRTRAKRTVFPLMKNRMKSVWKQNAQENNNFFSMAKQPLLGQDLLIIDAPRSHLGRQTTLGSTPLDEWSARRRNFYLTTHITHKRQTTMTPVGFQQANGRTPTS